MPIKKRRTVEEAIDDRLSLDWHSAIRHPMILALSTYADHPVNPKSVNDQIARVVGWKGAPYKEKVFVFLLASLLWRHNGESFLSDPQYDRLSRHLWEHADDVMSSCGLLYHSAILWDHPPFALKYGRGELDLTRYAPPPPKRRKKKRIKAYSAPTRPSKPKPKRRKLRKHKA